MYAVAPRDIWYGWDRKWRGIFEVRREISLWLENMEKGVWAVRDKVGKADHGQGLSCSQVEIKNFAVILRWESLQETPDEGKKPAILESLKEM